ncbi:major facilitator superfamily domain-containing protein [Xylariaceae sp. FL0255]|nr:major facilitator superfamily domain-containing protein [Xylariaceae sp. FL0255]
MADSNSSGDEHSTHRRESSNAGTLSIDSKENLPISPDSPQPAHTHSRDDTGPDDEKSAGIIDLSPTASRQVAVPIPRSERRGFFPFLCLIPEVDQPYNLSSSSKWGITSIVALAAIAAPMGSAIFYPCLDAISIDLHVSKSVVNISLAVYLLSMSIFPLWWSSFSETMGRRNIYLVSFTLNTIFTIACGFSQTIGQLIAFRVFAGGASASVQAVGAGTIADIWESRQRGRAMGIFYLGPLCGPLLAPIIGGALTGPFGWRSTMWFLAVFGAVIALLVLLLLPETLPRRRQEQAIISTLSSTNVNTIPVTTEDSTALSRVSTRASAVQARTKLIGVWLKRALIDPLSIIKLMRFPAIALIVSYAAITFGSLYVLNICMQAAFGAPPYDYSPLIVGLLYIPSSLGYFIASLLGGPWIDRIMEREARKAGRFDARGELVRYPEDRMKENAWISATMFPAALIWFGWSVQHHLIWIVPAIAQFFFGAGSMLVFSMATTMLTEFMPRKASNGVALNNFVRNILSATGTVITQPLIDLIGVGWLCTAVALIAFVGGNVCLVLVMRNSQKWRVKMNEQME